MTVISKAFSANSKYLKTLWAKQKIIEWHNHVHCKEFELNFTIYELVKVWTSSFPWKSIRCETEVLEFVYIICLLFLDVLNLGTTTTWYFVKVRNYYPMTVLSLTSQENRFFKVITVHIMTLWKIFAVDTQFKQLRKRSLKKNSGFSGIRTRDLCDTGAVLYQLSYEAITVGIRSILVGPSCH